MKRRLFLLLACFGLRKRAPAACPIRVVVGPDLSRTDLALTVIVPSIAKKDVVDIVSTFLGRGEETNAAEFRRLIGRTKGVTLVLTTECPPAPDSKKG